MKFLVFLVAIISLAGLFAHVVPSYAQVFKCKQGGVVSCSDKACAESGASQKPLDIKINENPKLNQRNNFAVSYYDVRGTTLEELRQSLDANGPKGFHGLASWKVNYSFKATHAGNLGKMSELNLTYKAEILMPRWIDAARAPRELVRQWEVTNATLKRHEDGHIAHGNEFLVRVRQALMAIPAMPCERLEGQAKKVYEDLRKIYVERDAEYDRRTKHGTSQDTRAI